MLSVILCTHNPRTEPLHRTLESLRGQDLPLPEWELIVVDNGSTSAVSTSIDLSWHPRATVVREDRLGLTHARLRGIETSRGDLLVFVDDDNVLDPQYLANARALAQSAPHLGCFGGSITGEFGVEPPPWARPYLCYLAVRKVDRLVWTNEYRFDVAPCGAGMCLRRDVALEYAAKSRSDPRRLALGRSGASLASGEDSDIAFTALGMGLGIGLSPNLKLTHLIGSSRLSINYLEKLLEAIGASTEIVELLHGMPSRPPARGGRLNRLLAWYGMRRQPAEVRRLEKALAAGRLRGLRQLSASTSDPSQA